MKRRDLGRSKKKRIEFDVLRQLKNENSRFLGTRNKKPRNSSDKSSKKSRNSEEPRSLLKERNRLKMKGDAKLPQATISGGRALKMVFPKPKEKSTSSKKIWRKSSQVANQPRKLSQNATSLFQAQKVRPTQPARRMSPTAEESQVRLA